MSLRKNLYVAYLLCLTAICCFLPAKVSAQTKRPVESVPAQQVSPGQWPKFQFLLGSWNAAGTGSPGEGAGEFSFSFELQKRVLVRRSHTDYPASPDRPAFAHYDLMIIYTDEQQYFHADYYDNEGHVIRYAIEFSTDGNACTFVSNASAQQPGFRLTYKKLKEGQLAIKFEIAPPDKPTAFKTYVEGTARRSRENVRRNGGLTEGRRKVSAARPHR